MFKHLFFDDTRLLKRENLARDYGKPVSCGTFIDPRVSCGYAWAFATRGPDGRFYLLYHGYLDGQKKIVPALAVSDDGVSFKAAEIPEDALPKQPALPNQLDIPLPNNSEIATLFDDPTAPKSERYKILLSDHTDLYPKRFIDDYVLSSPDLFHWTRMADSCWNTRGTEPVTGCFHNPIYKTNVVLTRPDWGQRRFAITETVDWHRYSPMELCMQADSEDLPLAEIYGMTALELDGWFIGFPLIYTGFPQSFEHKFRGGTMGVQLAYSLNGRHWQRSLRKYFLGPELDVGDGLWQMTFPTSYLKQEDGSWLIYTGSSHAPHGSTPEEILGMTAVRILRLRKDGFICLKTEKADEPSLLALREAVWNGGDLTINLVAENATCAIYDTTDGVPTMVRSHEDCIPFSGDSTNWTPQWKNGNLDDFKKKTLIVEIAMTNGKLFSIEYDAIPLMTLEGIRYRELGILEQHPGF
ncbi:MAG: hypothetical protein IJS08_03310 [Victivallales bacterium]|nr:hypothetical protein [Victivallales bacterium]